MTGWRPDIPGYDSLAELLSAARGAGVDWEAISVADLTRQLRTALTGGLVDMPAASDMAADLAELLALKAAFFLPGQASAGDEDEEGGQALSQEMLVERLMEYRAFRQAALTMEDMALKHEERFARLSPEVLAWEESLGRVDGVTLEQLLDVLAGLLRRAEEDGELDGWVVERDEMPLPAVMDWLQSHLETLGGAVDLPSLFPRGQGRAHIVATFLALLEMVRVGRVSLGRREGSAEIVVSLGSSGHE